MLCYTGRRKVGYGVVKGSVDKGCVQRVAITREEAYVIFVSKERKSSTKDKRRKESKVKRNERRKGSEKKQLVVCVGDGMMNG